MRRIVMAAAVLFAVGCGGSEDGAREPVAVAFSCPARGGVACPGATSVHTVTAGNTWWIECVWDCGTYRERLGVERTGRVVAALWPACGSRTAITWSDPTCTSGTTSSVSWDCNDGWPTCDMATSEPTATGILCSRDFATVHCGDTVSTGTVTTSVSVYCGRDVVVEEPGGCG